MDKTWKLEEVLFPLGKSFYVPMAVEFLFDSQHKDFIICPWTLRRVQTAHRNTKETPAQWSWKDLSDERHQNFCWDGNHHLLFPILFKNNYIFHIGALFLKLWLCSLKLHENQEVCSYNYIRSNSIMRLLSGMTTDHNELDISKR